MRLIHITSLRFKQENAMTETNLDRALYSSYAS